MRPSVLPPAFRRALAPLAASLVLAACQAAPPVAPPAAGPGAAPLVGSVAPTSEGLGDATLAVRASFGQAAGCRALMAYGDGIWALGVSYIEFQLWEAPAAGSATRRGTFALDAAATKAQGPVVYFKRLKPNARYRVEARAYVDEDGPKGPKAPVLLSNTAADSDWQTHVVISDLENTLDADLIVRLKDRTFDGKAGPAGVATVEGDCFGDLIGAVGTVAGSGAVAAGQAGAVGKAAQLGEIADVAFRKADGCLYAALKDRHCVVKIDPKTRLTTVVVGQYDTAGAVSAGAGGAARLEAPTGLAFDAAEASLYIAESGNDRILGYTLSSDTVSLAAGPSDAEIAADVVNDDGEVNGDQGGLAHEARFDDPHGLVHRADGLYVVDRNNRRIRRVDADSVDLIAGTGDDGYGDYDAVDATTATFDDPIDLAILDGDELVLTDREGQAVVRLYQNGDSPNGWSSATVARNGDDESDPLDAPTGIAVDPRGRVYVGDANSESPNAAIRAIASGAIRDPGSWEADTLITTWIEGIWPNLAYRDGGRGDAAFAPTVWPKGYVPVASDAIGRIYFGDEGAQTLRLLQ